MKAPDSVEEIYRAKEKRRKYLSSMSIDEKIKLIEKLNELGRTLRSARAQMNRATAVSESR